MKRIFQHPNFVEESYSYDYDIAILLLKTPIQFGVGVKSISLATTGTNIVSGLAGYATGWGLTSANGHQLSDRLKYVTLPTISLGDCVQYYGNNLTERMFCAGYAAGGKDTCQVGKNSPQFILSCT